MLKELCSKVVGGVLLGA